MEEHGNTRNSRSQSNQGRNFEALESLSTVHFHTFSCSEDVQSGASYLSQGFVMFFHVNCEGLPGQ